MHLFVTVPGLQCDDCLTGSRLNHYCSSILNRAWIFQLFSSVQVVRVKYVLLCRHLVSIWQDWRPVICQNSLVLVNLYITMKCLTYIPITDITLQIFISPWSWILTEKLRVRHLVKKFSACYRAWSFNKFFIRTCHLARGICTKRLLSFEHNHLFSSLFKHSYTFLSINDHHVATNTESQSKVHLLYAIPQDLL